MKLTIDSGTLRSILSRAIAISTARDTVPILECLLLKADGDALTVQATDMEIETTDRVPCVVTQPGSCAVKAKSLADFVGSLPAGQVTIEVTDKLRVKVSSGTYRAALAGLDPVDFPEFKTPAKPVAFSMPATGLAQAIKRVAFAQGINESMSYINGMHICATVEALEFVATNGKMLAVFTHAIPVGAQHMPAITIPSRNVAHIAKLLADLAGDITLSVSENLLEITAGEKRLATKLIGGPYPQYRRLIPGPHVTLVRAIAKPISEAIGVIASVGTTAVKLAISDDGIDVSSAQEINTGTAGDEAAGHLGSGDVSVDGPAMDVGVAIKLVQNILSVARGDVEIAIRDAEAPMVFRDAGEPAVLYVVMPYRV